MNIFTRFLAQGREDDELAPFVAFWDEFEALVIGIYRAKESDDVAERRYAEVAGWLRKEYYQWAPRLQPHWREAKVDGRPAGEDPFATLLAVARAADFVGNWAALQQLPAAREAINRWLVASGRQVE